MTNSSSHSMNEIDALAEVLYNAANDSDKSYAHRIARRDTVYVPHYRRLAKAALDAGYSTRPPADENTELRRSAARAKVWLDQRKGVETDQWIKDLAD